MSRSAPTGLLVSPTRSTALLIIRTDGTLYGLTESTVPFTFNGHSYSSIFPDSSVTYTPVQGFNGSNIHQESGTAVDNLEATTLLSDILNLIKSTDIIGTRFENARVIVFEIDYMNASNGCLILSAYRLGKAALGDTDIKFELQGLTSFLKQFIGRRYTPVCDVLHFGDKRCDPQQTIRGARSFSLTVGAAPTATITDFFGDGNAAGYYSFGDASFTSGLNSGLSGQIKAHTVLTPGAYNSGTTYALGDYATSGGSTYISIQSGNTGHAPASNPAWWLAVTGNPSSVARIAWRTPPPYSISAGDTATLCFGCDRIKTTCKSVVNTNNPTGTNVENFQGFYLPDPDVMKIIGK